ncbi:MAG: mycothione reductase [Ilumatobacteraceae bacterium]|nr:mycothione reductase [Ilumatobacteraceae bacterium]
MAACQYAGPMSDGTNSPTSPAPTASASASTPGAGTGADAGDVEHFDVVIIGTGSGNSILSPAYDSLKVAIVERDVFGGTCLNRGCIPTKMFVYAADVAQQIAHASTYGIDAHIDKVRWPEIVDRIFGRIDPIPPNGLAYRQGATNITVFEGTARFSGPKQVDVALNAGGSRRISGANIVVAAGARPMIPDVEGLDTVEYHTSDTIMRLPSLPERLIVIGGGYIATEMAHVFGALGSKVTIVNRSGRFLSREDESVSHRFTEIYRERFECHMNARFERVSQAGPGGEITVRVHCDGEHIDVVGDALLVATGRIPNGDQLGLEAAGIAMDDDGYVVTDPQLRTNVEGVWALGDVANENQLKHVANAEAKIVAHNVVNPDDLRAVDLFPVPHAVFAGPHVASVGATEQELRHIGKHYIAATQNYGDVAYGWAMEDTQHFCKVIADPQTRLLLGAHIIGPQSSILIQQLIQAMRFGQTVDQIAREQLWIHPSLTEVVENALLKL